MNLLVHFSKFNGQTGKHSDPIYLPWLLQSKDDHGNVSEEDGEWEYIEDGPAEIIWQGNEIIVKKKKVKVPKGVKEKPPIQEVMFYFLIKFQGLLMATPWVIFFFILSEEDTGCFAGR